jgi:AcrR family transcriptional regulator
LKNCYRGVVTTTPIRRAGRQPADADNRAAILAAATARFTELGFRDTTMRAVAADAGVDSALVHYFFGTKEQLFIQAMSLPIDPSAFLAATLGPGVAGLGERLVNGLLAVLDEAGPTNPMLALIRSAATHESAARMLREFLTTAVTSRLAETVEVDRPELRAALCASQVMGLILAREVVALPPLPTTDRAVLVAAYGPALQHYLEDPLPE